MQVAAGAANENVVSISSQQTVGSATPLQKVVAVPADRPVDVAVSCKRVAVLRSFDAFEAREGISLGVTARCRPGLQVYANGEEGVAIGQNVESRVGYLVFAGEPAPVEFIGTGAANHEIGACVAQNGIVTEEATENIIAVGASDQIAFESPVECLVAGPPKIAAIVVS